MRGRDNGLPDYNTVRKCHGLPVIDNLADINPLLAASHPELFEKLVHLYGENKTMDIDLYVGGMLETVDGPGRVDILGLIQRPNIIILLNKNCHLALKIGNPEVGLPF